MTLKEIDDLTLTVYVAGLHGGLMAAAMALKNAGQPDAAHFIADRYQQLVAEMKTSYLMHRTILTMTQEPSK